MTTDALEGRIVRHLDHDFWDYPLTQPLQRGWKGKGYAAGGYVPPHSDFMWRDKNGSPPRYGVFDDGVKLEDMIADLIKGESSWSPGPGPGPVHLEYDTTPLIVNRGNWMGAMKIPLDPDGLIFDIPVRTDPNMKMGTFKFVTDDAIDRYNREKRDRG